MLQKRKIMVATKIYEELAVFLAESAPAQILSFRPSEGIQARYQELVLKKKNDNINEEESSELEHYFMLEHIFRIAKIRAAMQMEA